MPDTATASVGPMDGDSTFTAVITQAVSPDTLVVEMSGIDSVTTRRPPSRGLTRTGPSPPDPVRVSLIGVAVAIVLLRGGPPASGPVH